MKNWPNNKTSAGEYFLVSSLVYSPYVDTYAEYQKECKKAGIVPPGTEDQRRLVEIGWKVTRKFRLL
jgi:hypothetical protein